jgi:hypothetical protein
MKFCAAPPTQNYKPLGLMQKKTLQTLALEPYFVFLVQIKSIRDKMHQMINWKNFHLSEKKLKRLKFLDKPTNPLLHERS